MLIPFSSQQPRYGNNPKLMHLYADIDQNFKGNLFDLLLPISEILVLFLTEAVDFTQVCSK